MTIRAKYEGGVFKPLDEVDMKEGAIVEIEVPANKNIQRRSIKDFAFTGMWKGREDMPDGITYVNRLRDSSR
jgi:predicted DNA-binding antitoxin AbrB/MazE fold protein